jgi:cytochrome c biogenesis protein CcdA
MSNDKAKLDELDKEIAESDHEIILHLKDQIDGLHKDVQHGESQLALHEKIAAQNQLLIYIFLGLIFTIVMMAVLVVIGWVTKQTTVERELAFFERIILVLIGIVGGAVSSFFDVRDLKLTNSRDKGDRN